jgi:hypothetical protein
MTGELGPSLSGQLAEAGAEEHEQNKADRPGRYRSITTTRSSVSSRTAYAGPSRVLPESLTPP